MWDFVWLKGKAGGCSSPKRELRRRNGFYLGGEGAGWVALTIHISL